jgi:hypothetical protein
VSDPETENKAIQGVVSHVATLIEQADRDQVISMLRTRKTWSASELITELVLEGMDGSDVRRILQREFDRGTIKRDDNLQLYSAEWGDPHA